MPDTSHIDKREIEFVDPEGMFRSESISLGGEKYRRAFLSQSRVGVD